MAVQSRRQHARVVEYEQITGTEQTRKLGEGPIDHCPGVAVEVEKALVEVGDMLNFNLWWVVVQMGLRLSFALSLWLTWAITHASA